MKVIIVLILFGLVSKLFSELIYKLKEVFFFSFENVEIKSFIGGIIIIVFMYIVGIRDYFGFSFLLMLDLFIGYVNLFVFLLKIIFILFILGIGF